jgi:hypothetical protein
MNPTALHAPAGDQQRGFAEPRTGA